VLASLLTILQVAVVWCAMNSFCIIPELFLISNFRVLEVSHSICYIHGLYVMIIRLRGQMIDSVPTSFSVGYFFSGMVGPIVQVLKRICFKFLA
jgi:hypothetical protein